MKRLKWNLGIILIRLGQKVRGADQIKRPFKWYEAIGRKILQLGYSTRGEIPQKHYNIIVWKQ